MRKNTTHKNTIPKTAAAAAVTAMITLTSCTTTNPATDTEPAPPQGPLSVSLRVPETIPFGQAADLVVESAGHEGKKAELYAFSTEYDSPAKCTDTTVAPTPIILKNGPQTIPFKQNSTGKLNAWGDTWYVLTGEGFSTPCGAPGSKTRTLGIFNNPTLEACDPKEMNYNCDELAGSSFANTKEPFKYTFRAPNENSKIPAPLKAAANWVGPFTTLPEAKAIPCRQDPIAIVETKELKLTDLSYSALWEHPIKNPGIYRVIFSISSTPYSAPYQTPCEAAPLVTVKAG